MKQKEQQIIFYSDPLNDDFANNNIKTKEIKNDYRYLKTSWLYKVNSFLLKYLLAVPALWIANTLIFRPKIENKKLLKQLKKKGYYLYSNHVLPFDPIVLPIKTQAGKHTIIIAGPDLFSISGFVSWLVEHFGAIPTPNMNLEMHENFVNALSYHIKHRHRVLIYPEAHIWPYYNDVRHFKPVSFHYPVNDNAPVVVATTTFKKRKGNRKPKPIIYLDGPFYPNETLSPREQVVDLAETVYNTMKWRAGKDDNFEYIKYVKKDD